VGLCQRIVHPSALPEMCEDAHIVGMYVDVYGVCAEEWGEIPFSSTTLYINVPWLSGLL
jgi:hypothetical protein